MKRTILLSILILLASFGLTDRSLLANDYSSGQTNEAKKANRFVKKIDKGGWVIDSIQANDGDYLTLSQSPANSRTFIVRKIKPTGKVVWETSIQIDSGELNSMTEVNDGYVLAGSTLICLTIGGTTITQLRERLSNLIWTERSSIAMESATMDI
jgi:hypothetical protein